MKETDWKRRRSTTLLRELTCRVHDQCMETGREALGDFIFELEDEIRKRPAVLAALRPRLINILTEDDWLLGAVEHMEKSNRRWRTVDDILAKALVGAGGASHGKG